MRVDASRKKRHERIDDDESSTSRVDCVFEVRDVSREFDGARLIAVYICDTLESIDETRISTGSVQAWTDRIDPAARPEIQDGLALDNILHIQGDCDFDGGDLPGDVAYAELVRD